MSGTSSKEKVASGQQLVASGQWSVASEKNLPSPACGRGAGGEGGQPSAQVASGQRPVASKERSGVRGQGPEKVTSNDGTVSSVQDTEVVNHKSEIINHKSLSPLPSPLSSLPPFLLLLDPPAPGPWNMAVDEALLEAAAAEGQCTLRFYQWSEPTLSLGYFQTYADRWQHKASSHSAVVRRSSGGGAIMHDLELTYSIAVPDRHPLAIDRLGFYQAVHKTLIATLAQWGIEAFMFAQPHIHHWPGSCENLTPPSPTGNEAQGEDASLPSPTGKEIGSESSSLPSPASGRGAGGEGGQPSAQVASGQWSVASESAPKSQNPEIPKSPISKSPIPNPQSPLPSPLPPHPQPFLCFQRRAPGDVLIGETKITGSAQRRCRGAVLQHGSVLLARSAAAPELDGLKELTGRQISPDQLTEAWLKRLAEVLPGGWQTGTLSDAARRRAETIVLEKHATAAWIEHRGRI